MKRRAKHVSIRATVSHWLDVLLSMTGNNEAVVCLMGPTAFAAPQIQFPKVRDFIFFRPVKLYFQPQGKIST